MHMVGENFNEKALRLRQARRRRLLNLLVSGPVGGTDPVLWTLLRQDGTAPDTAGASQRQPRPFPGFVTLRAFWAVAVRIAFARGP
jgi:hypothetical protein